MGMRITLDFDDDDCNGLPDLKTILESLPYWAKGCHFELSEVHVTEPAVACKQAIKANVDAN